jgi:hypothetical protein
VKNTEIDGILPTIKYEIFCEPVTSYNTARISMLKVAFLLFCDAIIGGTISQKCCIEPEIPSRNDCRNNGQ